MEVDDDVNQLSPLCRTSDDYFVHNSNVHARINQYVYIIICNIHRCLCYRFSVSRANIM